MRNRSGVTLLQIGVVLFALVIVVALMLPNVESARETARRMSCSNNFKQIGLGIHNYHAYYNQTPTAMFGTESNEHRLSGLVALTPFIEASPYWEMISNPGTFGGVDYPSMGPVPWDVNYEPWKHEWATFRCPSDASRSSSLGRTNYAFCVADRMLDLYAMQSLDDVRGFSAPRMRIAFDDITDGLSNTVAMAEIGTKNQQSIQGQFTIGERTDLTNNPGECLKRRTAARPYQYASHLNLSNLGRGGSYADGSGGFSLVHTILPPNSPSCAIGNNPVFDGVFSAGSFHQGGCHVLMADGAVKFVTDSIDTGDLS